MSDQKIARPVKRWFGMRPWAFVTSLVCLTVGGLIYFGSTVKTVTTVIAGAGSKEELLPVTTNLPDTNRIEIESIESNPNGQVTKILASNVLSGEKADAFAKLWRSQTYVFGEYGMDHQPGYRLKFYRQNSLFVSATVCFGCDNIYFNERFGVDFEAKTASGTKLRAYLSNLFPGHDAEAESAQKPN